MAVRTIDGWLRRVGTGFAWVAAVGLVACGPVVPTGGDTEAGTPATSGQHVYLAFRETGLRVTDWSTLEIVGREKDDVVIEQWARIGFVCQDGLGEALGLQVPIPDGAKEISLSLTLTDVDGDVVTFDGDTALE